MDAVMALQIYHHHRLETLFDPAASLFSGFADDPFSSETILVQSLGMGRYFVLEMAKRLGVFANYRIIFPNQLFFELGGALCGAKVFPDKQTSAWIIFDLLKKKQVRSLIPGMDRYQNGDFDGLELYKFSESIADIFDQYTLYRPETVLAWDNQQAVYIVNGYAHPLPDDSLWQMHLWNMLSKKQGNHRARLRRDLLARIESSETIPLSRLVVFGVSTLPQFHLDILAGLSERLPVHMFLLNPSESTDWFNDVSEHIIHRVSEEMIHRTGEAQIEDRYFSPGNTILTRNGREGADFFSLIMDRASDFGSVETGSSPGTDTMLEMIQCDISQRLERTGNNRGNDILKYCIDDTSIRVGACYGLSRELEALHDEIIAAFENDPLLEPKDILVMVPDIEQYASYIKGVFDVRSGPGGKLPYSIADLNITHDNEIASLFLSLCDMIMHGITYIGIKDFLTREALRCQLDAGETELDEFLRIIYDAGFRWGRDEDDHHEGGARFYQNSWHECSRRLWSGVAFEQGEFVQESVIASAVNENMITLAGRVMACVERMIFYSRICESPRSVGEWTDLCLRMLEDFFPASAEYASQSDELIRAFGHIETNAEVLDTATMVSFECYHYCIKEYLSNERRIFGFLDGKITFCELLPMRSVPFRMICLLGMNNGTIPRESGRSSFDLTKNLQLLRVENDGSHSSGKNQKTQIFQNRQKGDRDRRDDDRYLFLETLMSARSRLYISYNAKSPGGERDIPPSLLVSELLEYLDLCIDFGTDTESGKSMKAADCVVITHYLQPYAEAYYQKDSPIRSYDYAMFRAATACAGKTDIPVPADIPLQGLIRLNCTDVINFFRDPQRYFVKSILHAEICSPGDNFEQNEPFVIDYNTERDIFEMLRNESASNGLLRYFPHTGRIPPLNYGSWMLRNKYEYLKQFIASLVPAGTRQMVEVFIEREFGNTRVIVEGTMPLYDGFHSAIHLHDSAYNLASAAAANILLSSCASYRGARYQVPDGNKSALTEIAPVGESKIDALIGVILNGHSHPLHFHHRASNKFAKAFMKGKYKGNRRAAIESANNDMKSPYASAPNAYFSYCFINGFPFDDEFVNSALTLYDSIWCE